MIAPEVCGVTSVEAMPRALVSKMQTGAPHAANWTVPAIAEKVTACSNHWRDTITTEHLHRKRHRRLLPEKNRARWSAQQIQRRHRRCIAQRPTHHRRSSSRKVLHRNIRGHRGS